MRWLLNLDIGPRLALGFGGMLALTLVFGGLALYQTKRLVEQTTMLYQHPFTVTHAVDDVEIHLLKIHREMKDLAHARDPQNIADHMKRVGEYETQALESLAVVTDRFLGDLQKVEQLHQAIIDWRPIRREVIRLCREGQFEAADSITRGRGADHIALIENALAGLSKFAAAKAAESLASARKIQTRAIILTSLSLFGVSLLGALLAVTITRSIRIPIQALDHLAAQVTAGDLNHQVSVRSPDELGRLSTVFNDMVTSIRFQTEEIRRKNEENERLLLNILPGPVAERLKQGETRITDYFPDVTVLFADIVGFTPISSQVEPGELVSLLDELFSAFDELAEHHGIEKIKTIGDAYMAVAGLTYQLDHHAEAMVGMALEMIEAIDVINRRRGTNFCVRVGVNCGPVVAGIIGKSKFIYDLWGDTVNLASRMESHGVDGRIQVSKSVQEKVGSAFLLEPRGLINVKGKGELEVWLVEGRIPGKQNAESPS